MALCTCCFITAFPGSVSHTERPVAVCDACAPHYGDLAKTTAAHGPMMERYRDQNAQVLERLDDTVVAVTAERDAAVATAAQLTAAVASNYLDRPDGDVQRIIESAVIDELKLDATRARRARDLTMAAVGRILDLHHEAGSVCSCGKAVRDCPEYQALDAIRAPYLQWERRR